MVTDLGNSGQESKILESIFSCHILKNSSPPCKAEGIIEEFSTPLHTRGKKPFCCVNSAKRDLDKLIKLTKKNQKILQKMKKPLYQKIGTGMEKEITRTDIEMDKLLRKILGFV